MGAGGPSFWDAPICTVFVHVISIGACQNCNNDYILYAFFIKGILLIFILHCYSVWVSGMVQYIYNIYIIRTIQLDQFFFQALRPSFREPWRHHLELCQGQALVGGDFSMVAGCLLFFDGEIWVIVRFVWWWDLMRFLLYCGEFITFPRFLSQHNLALGSTWHVYIYIYELYMFVCLSIQSCTWEIPVRFIARICWG